MKFLIHCLAADVRRFWPAIAAWLFVVAAGASIDGIRPLLAADVRVLNLVGVAGTLLWLTELLLLFVLIALVVQAHPLVGSDAFWMTRPIPPSTLLASKLALLGILIVAAPAIAEDDRLLRAGETDRVRDGGHRADASGVSDHADDSGRGHAQPPGIRAAVRIGDRRARDRIVGRCGDSDVERRLRDVDECRALALHVCTNAAR
jgi:hypothetical protein